MSAFDWCRLWHDFPNDPKWRTIARCSCERIGDVIAVYIHLLINASTAPERGRTHNWNDEDVGGALDLSAQQVSNIRAAMQARVLDGDRLTGWDTRQPKREDGSAERSKAWREAQKAKQPETTANEQHGTQTNANERPEKRREEKKESSYEDSPPKSPKGFALPAWIPKADWDDFIAMRVKSRKSPTERAKHLIVTELEKLREQGHDPGAVLRQSIRKGWLDVFAIKDQPSTKPHAKHSEFEKQDYRAGTEGFNVV